MHVAALLCFINVISMRNLLNFLIKYHFLFLFLVLEMFSITLIIKYNNYQKVNVLNSSNALAGNVYNSYYSVVEYFSLKKTNEKIAAENAILRGELLSYLQSDLERTIHHWADSISYRTISAKVINNSVNKQYNYLT